MGQYYKSDYVNFTTFANLVSTEKVNVRDGHSSFLSGMIVIRMLVSELGSDPDWTCLNVSTPTTPHVLEQHFLPPLHKRTQRNSIQCWSITTNDEQSTTKKHQKKQAQTKLNKFLHQKRVSTCKTKPKSGLLIGTLK